MVPFGHKRAPDPHKRGPDGHKRGPDGHKRGPDGHKRVPRGLEVEEERLKGEEKRQNRDTALISVAFTGPFAETIEREGWRISVETERCLGGERGVLTDAAAEPTTASRRDRPKDAALL